MITELIESEKPKKRKSLLPLYLKGLASRKYTLRQASESTGYSIEYLCRLKKRYLVEGFACLDRKPSSSKPKNRYPDSFRQKIALIYSSEYEDINFLYFQELLQEDKGIKLSYKTIKSILNEYGIKSPEAHKIKKKKLHRPRKRRKNFGDLLQIDGTPYPIFYKFGDNKKWDIHGAIDDSTGTITGLYITENECLYGYMEILRQTIERYGIPREIYSDRSAIFCVTPKEKKNLTIWEQLSGIHDKKTQWQRILDELNINQILAWSPQAKGRVERMWSTIQGRLPMWLYRKGIKTVEEANARLGEFIIYFNSHFAKPAKKPESFFIPNTHNLDDILQCRIPRRTDINGCFSFHAYKWAVLDCPRIVHKDITVCISERGIFAKVENKYYNVQLLDDMLQEVTGEHFPQVLKNIIYRYLMAYGKEFSA